MFDLNFDDCKTSTAVKNKVREAFYKWLIEVATEKFGEDRVSFVFKGESTTKELSIGVQDIQIDGQLVEICVNTCPVVKDYENRVTASKTINAYERLCESDLYNEKQEVKKQKADEKLRLKKERIERDRKAREKRQAEKEKARQEKLKYELEDNG